MVQTDSSCAPAAELMPRRPSAIADELSEMAAPRVGSDSLKSSTSPTDGSHHRRPRSSDHGARPAVVRRPWSPWSSPSARTAGRVSRCALRGHLRRGRGRHGDRTGDVRRLVVVHDCGTVMFASGAEAQQVGSQCSGVGRACTEEIVYDRSHRHPTELQLDRLRLPHHAGLPRRRAGAPGGLAGRRRIRGLRHGRGRAHVDPAGHRQRRVQRHRGADRRDPHHPREGAGSFGDQAETAMPDPRPADDRVRRSHRSPTVRRSPDRSAEGRGRRRRLHSQRLWHDSSRRGSSYAQSRAAARRGVPERGAS